MYKKMGRLFGKTLFLVLVTWLFWHTMFDGSKYLENKNTYQTDSLSGISSDLRHVHPLERLSEFDYTTLMNLTTFRFVILNKCRSVLLLVVLVHSAPANYLRRRSIRKTWGAEREDVAVLFMLGDVMNEKLLEKIRKENRKYGDIIQGSFLDDYKNVTYKHVMTLKYAIYHCPQAKYVLKTDDDVFVNMPTLLGYLVLDLTPHGAKRLLSCTKQKKGLASSYKHSKWRLPLNDYNPQYFPSYCLGWVILYSPDVVFALYEEVQKTEYFWIDDVLLTGFVREKLNITIKNIVSLILTDDIVLKILSRKMEHRSIPTFLFGPAHFAAKNMYKMYEATRFKR